MNSCRARCNGSERDRLIHSLMRQTKLSDFGFSMEKYVHKSGRFIEMSLHRLQTWLIEYGLVDEILQPSQAKELTLVGGAASHE